MTLKIAYKVLFKFACIASAHHAPVEIVYNLKQFLAVLVPRYTTFMIFNLVDVEVAQTVYIESCAWTAYIIIYRLLSKNKGVLGTACKVNLKQVAFEKVARRAQLVRQTGRK